MTARGFLSRIEHNDSVQNYIPPMQRDSWRDPDSVTVGMVVRCQARDAIGLYTLPMLCIRTKTGWINARTCTPLHVQVIGWKYR